MKAIIKHFFWISSILVLSACSKQFLDVSPNLTITASTYFKTEQDFLEAMNGVYATLRSQVSNYVVMNELRSDNTCVYFNPSERAGIVQYEEIDEFRDGDLDSPSNYWDPAYSAIYRINLMLEKIQGITFSNEALRTRLIGECSFMRAYYYFNLVQFYGDVPLILKQIDNLASAYTTPRTPADEVYQQIMTDLQTAVSSLAVKNDDEGVGRATKGAALTLMAKVQLKNKDFSAAVETLRQIQTLGYHLQDNYKDCFDPSKKNNAESIFEIQYNAAIDGMSNDNIFTWMPIGSEAYKAIFGYTGSNRSGWNIPTRDLIAAYEPGDLRKDISLQTGYTNSEGNQVYSPYINKWVYDAGAMGRNNCNFPIFRYADVLLMLAEALNEVGIQNKTEVIGLLNQIRERAGLSPKQGADFTGQADLRLALEKERRVELAFEGHRWFDLVRTGRAIEVIKAYGVKEKANPSTPRGLGDDYLPNAFNIEPFRLLYPIPHEEIQKAPRGLVQNPGY